MLGTSFYRVTHSLAPTIPRRLAPQIKRIHTKNASLGKDVFAQLHGTQSNHEKMRQLFKLMGHPDPRLLNKRVKELSNQEFQLLARLHALSNSFPGELTYQKV